MEEFDNLNMFQLRELLADLLKETYGCDYAFGWLKTAYRNGYMAIDTNRDLLIDQIRKHTKVK